MANCLCLNGAQLSLLKVEISDRFLCFEAAMRQMPAL